MLLLKTVSVVCSSFRCGIDKSDKLIIICYGRESREGGRPSGDIIST